MSICLLDDKLNLLNALISSFSCKASPKKRQLKSVAGSLKFLCHVVYGGRTFLRHVIDFINKLRHLSRRCRLSSQFRADISWSTQFLVTFNGRSMMLDFRRPIFFDASFYGFSALCSQDCFVGSLARCSRSHVVAQFALEYWNTLRFVQILTIWSLSLFF